MASPGISPRRARPSARAVYLILSGATQLANTVNFTVLAIYYVAIVRMNPLQLVLVGTALEGTILLSELPTGLVADAFSRRPPVILDTAPQVVGVLTFALAGGFYAAIAGFSLADLARTAAHPIRDAWLARSISPRVRATVLSLMGQADAFGQVAGGPGIGALGKQVSLRAAIACSGALLIPALPLYAWTLRLPAVSDNREAGGPTGSEGLGRSTYGDLAEEALS